jgi:histone deacetylase 11
MRLATGGTILGVDVALKHGWAVNLSGGYHHAKSANGEGFCVYGDIALSAERFFEKFPESKVLVVDLDAHQGNGHEMMLGNDERVIIMDIYNKDIYPKDSEAEQFIDYKGDIDTGTKDDEYLELVEMFLEKAFSEHNVDFIIYNAGTDIFEEDPLGGLNISEAGIIKRDEIVFVKAKSKKTPILMLLSGGYTKKSGEIIGASLINVMKIMEE